MRRLFMLLPAAIALAGCATGLSLWDQATVDRVRIVDFGIYDRVDDAALSRLLQETTQVPARLGTSFGFRYIVEGRPRGEIATLTFHDSFPGLPEPGRSEPLVDAQYRYGIEVGAADICAYTFEHDWELVPGEWTFRIWRGDRLLAEKKFTVY